MRRQNTFDPATLHLSPMFTKFTSFPIRIGSSPDNNMSLGKILPLLFLRGAEFLTAAAIAL